MHEDYKNLTEQKIQQEKDEELRHRRNLALKQAASLAREQIKQGEEKPSAESIVGDAEVFLEFITPDNDD